jgi:hypothetical protein
MADKQDQKKKDGERKDKKVRRSVEASEARHRQQHAEGENRDKGDIITYKPGSESDRTQPGGRS